MDCFLSELWGGGQEGEECGVEGLRGGAQREVQAVRDKHINCAFVVIPDHFQALLVGPEPLHLTNRQRE